MHDVDSREPANSDRDPTTDVNTIRAVETNVVANIVNEGSYVTASGRRLNPLYTREDLHRLLPADYFLEDSQRDPNCRCHCCLMEWDLESDPLTEYIRISQQVSTDKS